jgi:hypothetical protein
MFVYINPLPSNQIAIAKEKTNGCNQKVLQKTFEEGVASSRAITGRGEAWRKENSSKAQDCEAELRAPGEHCA